MPSEFFGEYEYHVDVKGRIPLPPPFRERLIREGGYWAHGFEGCIRILPAPEWQKLQQKKGAENQTLKGRRFLRFNYSLSLELVVDGQGRITLPTGLRQQANIQSEAVVTGAGPYIEVWNPKNWQLEKEQSIAEAWQIQESME